MSRTDVTTFASAVYGALEAGESALVAVARGWSALEKSYGATSLYACRPVLNAEEIRAHYLAAGVPEEALVPADDMHVTIVYSTRSFFTSDDPCCYWYPSYGPVVRGGNRFSRKLMGHETDGPGALVLVLDSVDLVSEWNYFRQLGASWDYESYVPHVTVAYDYDGDESVPPFAGDVVLGPMEFSALSEKSEALDKFFHLRADGSRAILDAQIVKADDEQRVVWGWVSVATEKGEKVYDSHGDHIPMEELEKASVDFMLKHRVGKVMHVGGKTSDVIGCVPLSSDLAKALGIDADREGLIMGFRVNDDDVWDSVKKGELPAFSIGGRGIRVKD